MGVAKEKFAFRYVGSLRRRIAFAALILRLSLKLSGRNLLLNQNTYEAVVVDAQKTRTLAVPFAVSATISLERSIVASTGNPLSVYVGTPTTVLQNVVPTFVFAFLVGRFNGVFRPVRRYWVALSGRLLGGCNLSLTAIPVNVVVLDYLHLFPLPRKTVEVLLMMLFPVIVCTIVERAYLRVLELKQILDGTGGRNCSPADS
ncbi:hypothetical protein [Rhodopirellula europaea]|uniref:hypothetical protein n=1 Tax=Rhodopirellula europaea TaxID=1263866 RepID=UPI003D27A1F2